MPSFDCQTCGQTFDVPQGALDKYPGWIPKLCRRCKGGPSGNASTKPRKRPSAGGVPRAAEENLTVAEVLEKYTEGPSDGVFTDGASHPNPGPGGWGAVYVRDGEIVSEAFGADPDTTNNRMELTALIHGFGLVPEGHSATVFTDSQLCVNTITTWAVGWKKSGWKRKTGAIKNLDLVKELYSLHEARPEIELVWIKAHSGNRWNEYADALATAYRRDQK